MHGLNEQSMKAPTSRGAIEPPAVASMRLRVSEFKFQAPCRP